MRKSERLRLSKSLSPLRSRIRTRGRYFLGRGKSALVFGSSAAFLSRGK
jgi:hypothetical protein